MLSHVQCKGVDERRAARGQWILIQCNALGSDAVREQCKEAGLDLARLSFYKELALTGKLAG